MTQSDFLRAFGIGSNPFGPNLFDFLDVSGDGAIGFREFVYGLSVLGKASGGKAHKQAWGLGFRALRALGVGQDSRSPCFLRSTTVVCEAVLKVKGGTSFGRCVL